MSRALPPSPRKRTLIASSWAAQCSMSGTLLATTLKCGLPFCMAVRWLQTPVSVGACTCELHPASASAAPAAARPRRAARARLFRAALRACVIAPTLTTRRASRSPRRAYTGRPGIGEAGKVAVVGRDLQAPAHHPQRLVAPAAVEGLVGRGAA